MSQPDSIHRSPADAVKVELSGSGMPSESGRSSQQEFTRRERRLILVLAAIMGTVLGLLGWQVTPIRPAKPAPRPSAAVAAPSPTSAALVNVTSFDPLRGGTGFRKKGDTWVTQTYYGSPAFGNTKPGVGLVLDLGSAKSVSAVTFTAVTGPITVELRAGDAAPSSATSLQPVSAKVSASDVTRLTVKNGGSHRFWMIWVTQLASSDGGYAAVIKGPSVLA